MRKFTLFFMSLFLSVGAMAQATQKVEINLTTTAGQPGYVSSPHDHAVINPDSEWDKGGVAALIDGSADTHFHTAWENVPAGPHYFQVDLGEENTIGDFSFNYVSRKDARSDFPSQFTIKGSTNGNDFEQIKVINIDMPSTAEAAAGKSYSFDVTDVTKEYRYLRFEVTNTKSYDGAGYRIYFHAAEFDLFKIVTEETGRADYVHNSGNLDRDDRGLTSFTITDGMNSLEVTGIQTSRTAPVYVDKSAQKLTTYAGATLSFSAFSYTGSWMHAYAYVDYNKDFYFELVDNNDGTNDGEIVSYNYYDGKTITGTTSSQSDAMSNEYNGSKTLPAFTLPADLQPGEYRMRIKVDWNNKDADHGASDIAANGGAQCDITLVVEEVPANTIAKQQLYNAIQEVLEYYNTLPLGNGVGKYSSSIEGVDEEFARIYAYYNSIDENTAVEEIEAKTARIAEIIASYSLNMPKNGEYFRVAYDYGGTVGKLYLQGLDSEQEKNNQLSFPAKFAAESGAESIWYYYDGALYSYTAGRCLNETSNNRGLYNVGEKVDATFSASTRAAGKYNIACSSYVHANVTGNNYYTDHCSANNCNQHDLILEPVTKIPVSISAAGKATFFAPVAVEVAGDVKAYTVTINDEWATLNEITTGVIPANTGVVLEGAQNTYDFVITTTESTVASDLRGSAATTYHTEAGTYYALGIVDGVVAFYKDAFNNSRFQNNSHKAYLYVAGTNNAASYSFRFGEGTTGVENVEVENEVKVIYDLTGRRVEAITAPGIYIVGGKKVLVK